MIDKFRHNLLLSGYSQKEREIIVSEGVSWYTNLVKQAETGSRPLYRTSHWKREERAIARLVKERTWRKIDSVIFVQATPGEILRKEVRKIVNGAGFNVKVVEKGGRNMRSVLQRSDVSPPAKCMDGDYPICMTEGKGKCEVEGVVYKVWCKACQDEGVNAVMYGETGRTGKKRCLEHRNGLFDMRRSSNLRDHCDLVHESKIIDFGYSVVKMFPCDPLSRQLEEARGSN